MRVLTKKMTEHKNKTQVNPWDNGMVDIGRDFLVRDQENPF